ncbi:MAG: hypothetical protein CO137_02430 [Candidatus Magasanikbacteria bacterium CG_4_9_14_3_um_filter_32_9]|uniref:Rod shape-determining protein MreD n=1 Tax=Candidatus Magasanikbacteria bacterium CG_4_9_14_3_um_filter_32_9 TaxID=1974644 RepID=A0A2M7Z6K6_9BACT|nr:MAG: hypothetical protein CO137_02430 [Candidatus Magasanikbacteria bacterium CG_4_9_14_3_um_filter_32_9]
MKRIIKFISFLFSTFLIFFLHSFIFLALPFPFYQINLVFIVVVLMVIWYEAGWVVWYAFLLFLLLDFYSALPFGITLFSGTMSALIIFYLYLNIFTNKSWYGVLALAFLGLIVFRFIYIILIFLDSLIFGKEFGIISQDLFRLISWEIFLTVATLGIIFILLTKFTKRLNSIMIKT